MGNFSAGWIWRRLGDLSLLQWCISTFGSGAMMALAWSENLPLSLVILIALGAFVILVILFTRTGIFSGRSALVADHQILPVADASYKTPSGARRLSEDECDCCKKAIHAARALLTNDIKGLLQRIHPMFVDMPDHRAHVEHIPYVETDRVKVRADWLALQEREAAACQLLRVDLEPMKVALDGLGVALNNAYRARDWNTDAFSEKSYELNDALNAAEAERRQLSESLLVKHSELIDG